MAIKASRSLSGQTPVSLTRDNISATPKKPWDGICSTFTHYHIRKKFSRKRKEGIFLATWAANLNLLLCKVIQISITLPERQEKRSPALRNSSSILAGSASTPDPPGVMDALHSRNGAGGPFQVEATRTGVARGSSSIHAVQRFAAASSR